MIALLYKALDLLLAAFGGRRRLSVRAHLAAWVDTNEVAYFVKIVNLSRARDVEVTHVWVASDPPLAVLNPGRPLPIRLKPDETWETWIPFGSVPTSTSDVTTLVRVQLSSGAVYKSVRNTTVPMVGYVAGGLVRAAPPELPMPAEVVRKLDSERLMITRSMESFYRTVERALRAGLVTDELSLLELLADFQPRTLIDIAQLASRSEDDLSYHLRRLAECEFIWIDNYEGHRCAAITDDGADLLIALQRHRR